MASGRSGVALDVGSDPVELTRALVDVASVSGDEAALADAIERSLSELAHLRVDRDGDAVVARTSWGKPARVLLAGHIDTVPIADNLPSRLDGGLLYGCGTSDMKSGVAVQLRLAAAVLEAGYDLTYVFYDQEEVEAARNGLGRLARSHRDWLDADLAVLLEPTNGAIEAGCQGTLRAVVRTAGRRAHSARAWLGSNAIHAAAPVLSRLAAYEPREVTIDGCTYREGLQAVGISGGVAGNVVPDECTVTVNLRYAPDRTEEQAADHVRSVFSDFDVAVSDSAPAAPPGLSAPLAAALISAVGSTPVAKYGWTDVARFAAMGLPAVNYGPGDPNLAHTREESVQVDRIGECERTLAAFLRS